MAKRLKGVTLKRQNGWYEIHVKSRGSSGYVPFWKVGDIRSAGIKVKIRHFKDLNRVIHLLSINELFMYLLIAWDLEIIEVYEQYAIPLEESIEIANKLEIAHPVYADSKTPIIQTLDFLCTQKDDSELAYIVKQASELDNERTQEKLEIQREFCGNHVIKYEEVTSDELKTTRYENLERLFRYSTLDRMLIGVFRVWYSNFVGVLSGDRYERVANILEQSADLTGVPYQRAASFFFHAIWICLLTFDWSLPLVLESAASDLELYPNDTYFPS